jgi:hypothetical protein
MLFRMFLGANRVYKDVTLGTDQQVLDCLGCVIWLRQWVKTFQLGVDFGEQVGVVLGVCILLNRCVEDACFVRRTLDQTYVFFFPELPKSPVHAIEPFVLYLLAITAD